MRIYRLTYRCADASSEITQQWYGSLAEANAGKSAIHRGDAEEAIIQANRARSYGLEFNLADIDRQPVIFALDIKTTKKALIPFLNLNCGNY